MRKKKCSSRYTGLDREFILMKIAFISDIHANIFALQQVYEDLDKEKTLEIFDKKRYSWYR